MTKGKREVTEDDEREADALDFSSKKFYYQIIIR